VRRSLCVGLCGKIAELERENVRLVRRVERAEAIIEVQKKCHSCWELCCRRRRTRWTRRDEHGPGGRSEPGREGDVRGIRCRAGHVVPPGRAGVRAEAKRPSPSRRLHDIERQAVLGTVHEPRFVDLVPAEVFATYRSGKCD
jgi:hypothetical protein